MAFLKVIKRNPVNVAFTVALAACLFLSSKNVKSQFDSLAQIREKTHWNTAKDMELRASQQSAQAQADIANQRYKTGCLLLKNPLIQGQPVFSTETKKPLPRGTVVCDEMGNTGQLVPRDFDHDGIFVPVVADVAFTGDKSLIQLASETNKAFQ